MFSLPKPSHPLLCLKLAFLCVYVNRNAFFCNDFVLSMLCDVKSTCWWFQFWESKYVHMKLCVIEFLVKNMNNLWLMMLLMFVSDEACTPMYDNMFMIQRKYLFKTGTRFGWFWGWNSNSRKTEHQFWACVARLELARASEGTRQGSPVLASQPSALWLASLRRGQARDSE